jgi:hypothetical protein
MKALIDLWGLPNLSKAGYYYFFDINKYQGAEAVTWYVLLYSLVGGLRPRVIVDVGTQAGRSALTMAAALKDHGVDGMVYTIDLPDNRYHWRAIDARRKANLMDYVRFYSHGAPHDLLTLFNALDTIDLLFLDHAKERYAEDFLLVKDRVNFCVMHDVLIPQFAPIIQPQITMLKERCPEFEFFVPRFRHLWAGVALIQRRDRWPTYS